MMNTESQRAIMAPNRAEEYPRDVWTEFVVPLFFDELWQYSIFQPKIIEGGRGCGKTMLLKYLSHQSTFSPSRKEINADALASIGLYWRIDTKFAQQLSRRNRTEDEWVPAFIHFATLTLSKEVLNSLRSIVRCEKFSFSDANLSDLDFAELKGHCDEIPATFVELWRYIEDSLARFSLWINNLKKVPEPTFLGDAFVKKLIEIIKAQVSILADSTFFVYLDEYETFLDYQKRIINTWIKHSERPLIFNVAMKRSSFQMKETLGSESLQEIHDYRSYDLEDLTGKKDFDVFAAEVIFLWLVNKGVSGLPINPLLLQDPSRISTRKTAEYRTEILDAAKHLLPYCTYEEFAKDFFTDKTLHRQLRRAIASALKDRHSRLLPKPFLRPQIPGASVVCVALLNRDRYKPAEILSELKSFEKNGSRRFSEWIHNNLLGCLLYLYGPLPRTCPIFSGYERYCEIAGGNLRFLLEMAGNALGKVERTSTPDGQLAPASIIEQAQAAEQASEKFLREVQHSGRRGNQLYFFAHRLGYLFRRAHDRSSQSEPEITHFSIIGGLSTADQELLDFFSEAIKWGVLVAVPGTKQKSEEGFEPMDYVLNPIFSPYFKISFRKIRKLSISQDTLRKLVQGSVQDYKEVIKSYSRMWSAPIQEESSLFSELDEN